MTINNKMWRGLRCFSRPMQSQLRNLWQPAPLNNLYALRFFAASKVSVESTIVDTLKTIDGVDLTKVSGSSTFKEVGLDSLAQIGLFSTLEEVFDITLTDDDTEGVKAVQDLVKIVLSKLK